MESVAPDQLLLIGSVWRAHGVDGEIKILPETDEPARFLELDTLYLGADPPNTAPHTVESARLHQMKRGTVVIVKLEGVDAREGAEILRRVNVFAPENDLPPLEKGEAFIHDLVGLEVDDESGEWIGTVKDVMVAPAHPLYVVAREGKPDALVPAVEKFVAEVDVGAGRLVIRPIEGLLD